VKVNGKDDIPYMKWKIKKILEGMGLSQNHWNPLLRILFTAK